MKFNISSEVFDSLEDYCVAIVLAKGIDNGGNYEEVENILHANIASSEEFFEDKKVREVEEVAAFRDAFRELGMNPNKFRPSIEALLSRIAKKKGFPSINPIVDLGNAVSVKYRLPIGAHDLDTLNDDLEVRFSKEGDHFIPFGQSELEHPEEGELLYVSGDQIRTRRWIWRQSELGKIGGGTKNVFFPIDGFIGKNKESTLKARDELAELLEDVFNCQVITGFVDRDNPSFEMNFK